MKDGVVQQVDTPQNLFWDCGQWLFPWQPSVSALQAGLEDISSGELKIGDKVVNDVEPKDRDIAMVFQNYALYPHMSVYDNMAFGLKLRKYNKVFFF